MVRRHHRAAEGSSEAICFDAMFRARGGKRQGLGQDPLLAPGQSVLQGFRSGGPGTMRRRFHRVAEPRISCSTYRYKLANTYLPPLSNTCSEAAPPSPFDLATFGLPAPPGPSPEASMRGSARSQDGPPPGRARSCRPHSGVLGVHPEYAMAAGTERQRAGVFQNLAPKRLKTGPCRFHRGEAQRGQTVRRVPAAFPPPASRQNPDTGHADDLQAPHGNPRPCSGSNAGHADGARGPRHPYHATDASAASSGEARSQAAPPPQPFD